MRMNSSRRILLVLSICLMMCFEATSVSAQELSPTRKLRRVYLALVQHEPEFERYEALLESDDADAFIEEEVDRLLDSPEFHEHLVQWGREYMPFPQVATPRVWRAGNAINSTYCGDDTLHAGALAITNGSNTDDGGVCDDPAAPTSIASPWWDPSQSITTVGIAANQDTFFEGTDCGTVNLSNYWVAPKVYGCGCGPNLIFCHRGDLGLPYMGSYNKTFGDGEIYHPLAQRRAIIDEPANLLAHIVTNDRPFSDLVLGNYTVANQGLYYMYLRAGRQSGVHTGDDENRWFDRFPDKSTRLEVTFEEMNPHLLDDPDYTFDPRVDTEIQGIPSAGVLTMIGPNAAWPRERVRAARWLESLACDEFSPPEVPIDFPIYQTDPATEGVCLHCHTRLDAAAISFKRIFQSGSAIAGVGRWRIENFVSYDANRQRFESTYLPNTVLTPLSQEDLDSNSNSRLIDYMQPGQLLLGVASDGTVGPRGFAKILVESGAFDQCAVRRAHERFGGRALDLGMDAAFLRETTERFVASNRNMKALIRELVLGRNTGW